MTKFHTPSGLPMIHDGEQWRILGCLPSTDFAAPLPPWFSAFPVVPESEWDETATDMSHVPVFNQGSHSSCVGHGTVTAFTFAWIMSGQPFHVFSPTSIYARINGGRDKGAMVADGLAALKTFGTCFMDQFGEDQIYAQQLPPAAVNTALRFRVHEAYKVSNWAEMGSAINRGLIVVSGLAVGNNFSKLDANGVCPLPDMIAGGHCLAHYGLKKIDGVWMLRTRNSWGNMWGQQGDCYIQQGAWNPQYGFPFDAFAIGGVLDDPQETDTDPPVLIV